MLLGCWALGGLSLSTLAAHSSAFGREDLQSEAMKAMK